MPTCSPIHVILSPERVFMVISVLTLFANYFDTGILSARRVSSMTHSLHPPMTKTRCVPVLTPASANSTVTSMRIDHPRCPGRAGIYATTVTDPTIRNGSNSQHVFSPNDNRKRSALGRAYVWREQPGDITRLSFSCCKHSTACAASRITSSTTLDELAAPAAWWRLSARVIERRISPSYPLPIADRHRRQ